ncbi:hypothetical protein B0H13DRAFT_2059281, partial [Mycena leptocephala]
MFSKISVVVSYVLIVRCETSKYVFHVTNTYLRPLLPPPHRDSPPPVIPPTSPQCCERVVSSTSVDASRVAALL